MRRALDRPGVTVHHVRQIQPAGQPLLHLLRQPAEVMVHSSISVRRRLRTLNEEWKARKWFMADSSKPKAGGLWGRLFGLGSGNDEPEPSAEAPPPMEPPPQADAAPPEAAAPPVAESTPPPVAESPPPAAEEPSAPEPAAESPVEAPPLTEAPAAAPQACPACGTMSKPQQRYCEDCGWMFTANGAVAVPAPASAPSPDFSLRGSEMASSSQALLRDRYELRQMIAERQGTRRYRGFDHSTGQSVVIVATPLPAAAPIVEAAVVPDEEILPSFDDDVPVAAIVSSNGN